MIALLAGLLLLPGARESFSGGLGALLEGDGSRAREEIQSYGLLAPLVSLGLILLHIVVPFPAEVLAIANGVAFGFWGALVTTWSGFMAAALLTYGAGSLWGRPLLERFVPTRQRERLDNWLAREGFFPLLAMRLLPLIPFNALCLGAGVVRAPLWTYTWTTAVGILPLDVALSLVGSRLGSEADLAWWFWVLLAVMLALVLLAWAVSRRMRPPRTPEKPEKTSKAPGSELSENQVPEERGV